MTPEERARFDEAAAEVRRVRDSVCRWLLRHPLLVAVMVAYVAVVVFLSGLYTIQGKQP